MQTKRIISKMRPITNKIKEKYGTLKNYAKKRNINYGSLRIAVSGTQKLSNIENILQKDGFLPKKRKTA